MSNEPRNCATWFLLLRKSEPPLFDKNSRQSLGWSLAQELTPDELPVSRLYTDVTFLSPGSSMTYSQSPPIASAASSCVSMTPEITPKLNIANTVLLLSRGGFSNVAKSAMERFFFHVGVTRRQMCRGNTTGFGRRMRWNIFTTTILEGTQS